MATKTETVKLVHPNGTTVVVAKAKEQTLVRRGFTKPAPPKSKPKPSTK